MTPLRGLVVSAVLAALLGAPPTVSATVDLTDADASPLTGTASGDPGSASEEPAMTDALRLTAVSAALLVTATGIWFAVWARRRRRQAAEAEARALAAETEAILDRRARRRARVHLPEDPIVASLGIDEPDPAARGRRRRRSHRETARDEP